MALPTIRKPTVAPSRKMARDVYPIVADEWAASIGPFTEDLITAITWMGNQVTDVAGFRDQAAASVKAAAQSVTDAVAQVKLATDQAVASKGYADTAKGYRDSAQVSAQAAQAAAGLPPDNRPGWVLRQKLDGSGGVEWWLVVVNQIGDTLVSSQAPDSNWVPTARYYPQNNYPALYAKLGAIADWVNAYSQGPNNLTNVNGNNYPIQAIAYGNGWYIAMTNSGGYVQRSQDGFNNWTTVSVSADAWTDLDYGNGRFVAVWQSSVAGRSTDNGLTWNAAGDLLPGSGSWRIRFGANNFLAAAINTGSTANSLATTTDGVTFTKVTAPSSVIAGKPAYGFGLYVMLTADGCFTSPTGATWTKRPSFPFTIANGCLLECNPTAGGGFLAVNPNTREVAFSADGITWAAATPIPVAPGAISGGQGGFFLQTGAVSYTTVDGSKWFARPFVQAANAKFIYANRTHIGMPAAAPAGVARMRAYSYDPATQFFTTEQLATPQGLNQFIKAA